MFQTQLTGLRWFVAVIYYSSAALLYSKVGSGSSSPTPSGTSDSTTDGSTTDSSTTDDSTTDGYPPDGSSTDGSSTDGSEIDGSTTDSSTTDGSTTDGSGTDGSDSETTVAGSMCSTTNEEDSLCVYLGCFKDSKSDRVLGDKLTSDVMTTEVRTTPLHSSLMFVPLIEASKTSKKHGGGSGILLILYAHPSLSYTRTMRLLLLYEPVGIRPIVR